MFRSLPHTKIEVLEYNSAENQMGSDHKPVYGIYKIFLDQPFVENSPLYTNPRNPNGLLRIKKLVVSFKFQDYHFIKKYYQKKDNVKELGR